LAEFRRGLNLGAFKAMKAGIALRLIRQILEQQVHERLLTREAARLGYGEREKITKEVRQIREEAAVNRLLGEVIFARISASEEDARAYYESHPQEFTDPEQVKLSLIRVDSEEEGREILSALQAGQEFVGLARSRSKDPVTAQVGGELGWVTRGRWNPDLEKVAFSLSGGEASLTQAGDAFYILRADGKREAQLRPFARSRDQATKAILRQKQREELRRWVRKLREASTIVIDQEAIARAVASYEEQVRKKAEAAKRGKDDKARD
jgi:parvulin-like peptidyl-prolyl isomerase